LYARSLSRLDILRADGSVIFVLMASVLIFSDFRLMGFGLPNV